MNWPAPNYRKAKRGDIRCEECRCYRPPGENKTRGRCWGKCYSCQFFVGKNPCKGGAYTCTIPVGKNNTCDASMRKSEGTPNG